MSVLFAVGWIEWLSVIPPKRSWMWKVFKFFHLLSTREFFVVFRTWSIQGNYTSLKRIISVLFWCLTHILCTDLENLFSKIFGNHHRHLNFGVVFRGNNKYENILQTPVIANSPQCMDQMTYSKPFSFRSRIDEFTHLLLIFVCN